MALEGCDCCSERRPIVAGLHNRADGEACQARRLCADCLHWLIDTIQQVRRSDPSERPLLGSPAASGRSLVFPDQCQLCRELADADLTLIEALATPESRLPGFHLRVCPSCASWVASLADDARSLRGAARRWLDGPYGEWLHPNLRNLSVACEVSDTATFALIRETCAAMDVAVLPFVPAVTADVLLIEAGRQLRASRLLMDRLSPAPSTVVLTPLSAQEDLSAALRSGATGWLTLPLTPQQLTAALSFARRRLVAARSWDPDTCLPLFDLTANSRPLLRVHLEPGVPLWDVAWSLRRYSRGYDELGIWDGNICLIPRATAADISAVAARLGRLLTGKCTFEPVGAAAIASRHRFEAAG